jgi:hypothetical protein
MCFQQLITDCRLPGTAIINVREKKKPRIPNEPRVRNLCAIYPDSFAESTAEVLVAPRGQIYITSPLSSGFHLAT